MYKNIYASHQTTIYNQTNYIALTDSPRSHADHPHDGGGRSDFAQLRRVIAHPRPRERPRKSPDLLRQHEMPRLSAQRVHEKFYLKKIKLVSKN